MPYYFFDVHAAGTVQKDEIGTAFETLDEVRDAARRFLPELACEEIVKGDEPRFFVVLVKDEQGRPVYSATLTYTELSLGH